MRKDRVPYFAKKCTGRNAWFIDNTELETPEVDPEKIHAIDMALWMENHDIDDAISNLSTMNRPEIDWKKIGTMVVVALVAVYAIYIMMRGNNIYNTNNNHLLWKID